MVLARQEDEDRRARKEVGSIVEDDPGEEEDMDDDDGVSDGLFVLLPLKISVVQSNWSYDLKNSEHALNPA